MMADDSDLKPIQISVRFLTKDLRHVVAILVECPECLVPVRDSQLQNHIDRVHS